jgi:lysophospholipase L1-like esterase
MFTVNEDLSIYATRGDVVFFSVNAYDGADNHTFKAGDVVRFKVFGKKDAENVILQKDFPVTEECEEVEIFLEKEDTKIGDVISKPRDYWYEVELNPSDNPQTIIGYDEDGAKVFRLFPEGDDVPAFVPDPEDISVMDTELDMTSDRPVQNQAIARAVVSLRADFETTKADITNKSNDTANVAAAAHNEVAVERARIDNLVSGATADDAELIDVRVGNNGKKYASAGAAVRGQFATYAEDYCTINGLNLVKGGQVFDNAWVNASGEVLTAEGSKYLLAPLKSNEAIHLCIGVGSVDMHSGSFGGFAFLDSMGEVVETILVQDYKTNELHCGCKCATIPVPDSAVAIRCTLKLGATWDATETMVISHGAISGTENPSVTRIDGYQIAREDVTKKDILNFCHISGLNLIDSGEIVEGAWVNQSGEIVTDSNSKYVRFNVSEGASLNFCIGIADKMSANSFGGFAFIDSSGEAVSVVDVGDYKTSDLYNNYECATIPVPSGAVMAMCTIKLSTAWDAEQSMVATEGTWHEAESPAISEICGYKLESIASKHLAGKTWVVMGDSLTEKNIRATKNYHDYIAEVTGISVINMGASGTGYKRDEENGKAFYQRVSGVPASASVVTIFGSGNDLKLIKELGKPSDKGTSTICGCVNTTIENLYAINPLMQIGIISPTPWIYNEPSNNSTMVEYCDALGEICKMRGIPFLDLFRCSGLRPNDEKFRQLAYSRDEGNGVHPDETGHKIIAPKIKAFLESLIM